MTPCKARVEAWAQLITTVSRGAIVTHPKVAPGCVALPCPLPIEGGCGALAGSPCVVAANTCPHCASVAHLGYSCADDAFAISPARRMWLDRCALHVAGLHDVEALS